MVLSFDSYMNTLHKQKRKDDEKIKNVEEKCQNEKRQMKFEIEN